MALRTIRDACPAGSSVRDLSLAELVDIFLTAPQYRRYAGFGNEVLNRAGVGVRGGTKEQIELRKAFWAAMAPVDPKSNPDPRYVVDSPETLRAQLAAASGEGPDE